MDRRGPLSAVLLAVLLSPGRPVGATTGGGGAAATTSKDPSQAQEADPFTLQQLAAKAFPGNIRLGNAVVNAINGTNLPAHDRADLLGTLGFALQKRQIRTEADLNNVWITYQQRRQRLERQPTEDVPPFNLDLQKAVLPQMWQVINQNRGSRGDTTSSPIVPGSTGEHPQGSLNPTNHEVGALATGVGGVGNTAGILGLGPEGDSGAVGELKFLDRFTDGAPWVLRNLGREQFKGRDYQGTYDTYTRLIGKGERDAEVRRMRGLAAHRLGDSELGHEDAKEALKLDPKDPVARDLLNMTKDRVSTIRLPNAGALADSKAGADDGGLGPRLASAGLSGPGLAGLRAPAGSIDPGAILAAVQARGGDSAQASRHLIQEAQSAWRVGDAKAAIVLASKALELDGQNPAAYAVRALARNHVGEFSSAAQDASSSLALLPPGKGAGVLGARAWAFNSLRRHEDALKDSLQARQIKPRDGFLLVNEARALGGLGRRGEMLERLREAAALEPAKYRPVLEQAMMLPDDADSELLFTRVGDASEAAASGRGAAPEAGGLGRALRLVLYVAAGGLLLAFGFKRFGVAERITQSRRTVAEEETAPTEVDESAPEAERPEAGPATAFLARYDGVRELAKGGMGVVYEATDRGLARKVAIKKMREELRTDPRERERFLQEARTVAGLRHPNIVQIYQVAEDGMDAYLVFEHVDGETLHQRLQRAKRLTFAETTAVMKGVCAAVEHAHAHGLMHRDLKPSNIMIDREGVVKVMDFGIARQAKDAMTKLSMTNTVCGTPPYMAPEQEQGLVCKESDIFSLGVLAYEMLSGTLPFDGPPAAMLLAKMSARFEPLTALAPGLPAGAEAVVARALSQDPAKRWRKPGEFLAALEALASAKPA